MNKKSIARNYIYNLTYQILILILPLITTPYISRVLGAENIGIYSYTLSIATYFILFGSLGISTYAQREIAYVQDNKKNRSKIFFEVLLLRIITMTISGIAFYFTYIIKSEYKIYYEILILEMIANCLDISWLFQGIEDFKKTVFRSMIIKIISVVAIFMFVNDKEDLIIYFIIYVTSNVLGNLSLWLYIPKYIQKINIKEINIFKHIKPVIEFFIPQIAIQCYVLLDKVMLGMIVNDKSEVGYYEQAEKIVKVLLTVITALGTVMMPRIANNYIKGENENIKKYMSMSFNFVFLLSIPMIFGIILISKKFVPIFLGTGYDRVPIIMNIISPILLMIGLSNASGTQFLLSTKRQKEYTISVIIGAVCNFLINLILIPYFGAIGAAIATVIAETIVTSVQFYFIRKDIKIKQVMKNIKNYIIAAVIMYIISIFIVKILPINNTIAILLIQVLIGCIIYFSVLIFILKDEFLTSLVIKVKEKFMTKVKI